MRLVLIDTFALIHRSYHALPKLTAPEGEPIGAVYGFTSLFFKMIKDLKPDYVAAAFDLPEETFRKKAYAEYQAHRPEMPSDLANQISKVKDLLEAFGVPVFSYVGYEADDVIGTAVEKLKNYPDLEIVILTGDLDTLQLVSANVKVYTLKKGLSETVLYDEDAVRERYGFDPERVTDFKGLKGDPSDNIPGVPGIGEKTAKALIMQLGTVENIYRVLGEKSGALRQDVGVSEKIISALRENRDQAFLSKTLATIQRSVPIDISLDAFRSHTPEREKIVSLFQQWGFKTFLARLDELALRPVGGGGEVARHTTVPEASLTRLSDDRAWQKLRHSLTAAKYFSVAGLPSEARAYEKAEALAVLVGRELFVWENGDHVPRDSGALFKDSPPAFTWGSKALAHLFKSLEVEPPEYRLDCQIAGWLLDPDAKRYGLEDLAHRYGTSIDVSDGALAGSLAIVGRQAHLTETLGPLLEEKIREAELYDVWEKIEKPLTPILADMEEAGIRVDQEILKRLSGEMSAHLMGIEKEIYRLTEEKFNIASPKQLSRVLFEKLHILAKGIRKTPGGVLSTDSAELEKLKTIHPAVPSVLTWREISKLLTTYVDALPRLINPRTGRIHTTFLQTGTATGRLASENPNLQNIPKRGEHAKRIRDAFQAKSGYTLVSFDYSQIELRIAAHLSRDEKMVNAFRRGIDIHALTASQVWDVPLEKVSPELRNRAKALNFGMIYGMGWKAFAETSGIAPDEAKRFIREYFAEFAGVQKYIDDVKDFARANGYARTLAGRKRLLPGLFSPATALHAQAERVAVNMPIQGFAADLIKRAMVCIGEGKENLRWGADVSTVLQVHDELLFEIKREKIDEVIPHIRDIMQTSWQLEVPIVVDVAAGDSWGSLVPYHS